MPWMVLFLGKMKTRETFNAAVLKRDGHQCVICRAKDSLTVHHILDRSLFLLLKMLLVSIMGALDAMRTNWKRERDLIQQMQKEGDIVLSFGWNSMGMGIKRGYKIIEGMLVCHGVGHYDTLCMAEKRM